MTMSKLNNKLATVLFFTFFAGVATMILGYGEQYALIAACLGFTFSNALTWDCASTKIRIRNTLLDLCAITILAHFFEVNGLRVLLILEVVFVVGNWYYFNFTANGKLKQMIISKMY